MRRPRCWSTPHWQAIESGKRVSCLPPLDFWDLGFSPAFFFGKDSWVWSGFLGMALGGDARSNPQLRWPRHRAKGPRWQRRKQANPTGDAEASGRAVTKGFRLRSMKDASGRPHQKQSFRKDCEIKLYPFSATISRRPDRSIGSGFLEACPRTCGKRPGPSARAFCKAKAKAAAFAKATLLWSGCAAERWIMAAAVLMFIFTTLVLYLYFCKVQTTLLCELFGVFQLPTLSFFWPDTQCLKYPNVGTIPYIECLGCDYSIKSLNFWKFISWFNQSLNFKDVLWFFPPANSLGKWYPKWTASFCSSMGGKPPPTTWFFVTFLGWWKRDPFNGESWPPNRGWKGRGLNHLDSTTVSGSLNRW